MKSYAPGQPVVVPFALVDEAGAVLTSTGLRARILDEAETVLRDWTTVDIPVAGQPAPVTVPGALNILTPPATRGARTVELEVTTAEGVVILAESFLLQAASQLSGFNSFQTYTQAVLLADDFSNTQLEGWHANPGREARERALVQAYGRIAALPIVIEFDDSQSIVRDIGEDPWRLADLTPAQVLNLDYRLLGALRKAQLVEASFLLEDDPVARARAKGMVSQTVGESSQFFGHTKALDLGASPAALRLLERWLRFRATLGRG